MKGGSGFDGIGGARS